MKILFKAMTAVLALFVGYHAQAGEYIFRLRILDESGVNYLIPGGTLVGASTGPYSGSGSTGSTTNSTNIVTFTSNTQPTYCYSYFQSQEGFRFYDVPDASYAPSPYYANINTTYLRSPCYNPATCQVACCTTIGIIIIPRETSVAVKKMGQPVANIPIQFEWDNTPLSSEHQWLQTNAVNSNAQGIAKLRVPKKFKDIDTNNSYLGNYFYIDTNLESVVYQVPSTIIPRPDYVVVKVDNTRPNTLTDLQILPNDTLYIEWENTASVPNVNHSIYYVEVYNENTGALIASGTASNNFATVPLPTTPITLSVWIAGYSYNNTTLYCLNNFGINVTRDGATMNNSAIRKRNPPARLLPSQFLKRIDAVTPINITEFKPQIIAAETPECENCEKSGE